MILKRVPLLRGRFRILFPRTDGKATDASKAISHWLVHSSKESKPISYGYRHLAFFKNGVVVEGFFKNKEFV